MSDRTCTLRTARLRAGNFDITDANYYLDGFGDLAEFFGCDQRPPQGLNSVGFCDRSLEPLFAEFSATYDEPT